eukprot:6183521-Pleurochrysis_carterae.AAC.1
MERTVLLPDALVVLRGLSRRWLWHLRLEPGTLSSQRGSGCAPVRCVESFRLLLRRYALRAGRCIEYVSII